MHLDSVTPAFLSSFLLAILASTVFGTNVGDYENFVLARVEGVMKEDLQQLEDLQVDISGIEGRDAIVLLSPYQMEIVSSLFSKVTIIQSNIAQLLEEDKVKLQKRKIMAADIDDNVWFSDYHNYDEIKAWYRNLEKNHPGTLRIETSIGTTYENRDIFAVHINPTPPREGKPQIWSLALIHAREWISGSVIQYVTKKLLQSNYDIEFIFIPVANPDGYEYTWTSNRLWRKNRSPQLLSFGVDLNRNFDDHWGSAGSSFPLSDTYQGPAPSSELEVTAIANYFLQNKNIVGALDWHCFSQLILYPYGWTSEQISNFPDYKSLTEHMAKAFALNGRIYSPKQAYDLYPTSGTSMDWYVGREVQQRMSVTPLSVTIELPPTISEGAKGFLLDPKYIIPVSQEAWEAFMVFISQLSSHSYQ